MSRRDQLRRIPVFADLSDAALDALEAVMVLKRLTPGGVLVEEGAAGVCAFAVLSGRLKVSTTASGRPVALNIVGPGALIGELSLLDPHPRSASAVALDPVRVLVLHRRDLLPFLRDHPDAALGMLAALARQLRQVSDDLTAQTALPLPLRLRRALDGLADRFGLDTAEGRLIDVALSQGELGQLVGASRESVNKQLRLWREDG
ncbi:MAG: CRP/FNR family cyclic AMP-dependent transcriptional regulator, partial [Myxococcota bacterium]